MKKTIYFLGLFLATTSFNAFGGEISKIDCTNHERFGSDKVSLQILFSERFDAISGHRSFLYADVKIELSDVVVDANNVDSIYEFSNVRFQKQPQHYDHQLLGHWESEEGERATISLHPIIETKQSGFLGLSSKKVFTGKYKGDLHIPGIDIDESGQLSFIDSFGKPGVECTTF